MRALCVVASVGALITGLGQAHGETIAICGASFGKSYYLDNPLLPKSSGGWRDDSINPGRLQLIRDGASNFDVLYTDASGGTRSARGEGFDVHRLVTVEPYRYVLIGVHRTAATIEHWIFELDVYGRGVVVWGTIRGDPPLPKSSLMKAECRSP